MVSRLLQFGKSLSPRSVTPTNDLLHANISLVLLGSFFAIIYIVGHATHILPFPFSDGVLVAHFLDQPRDDLASQVYATITFRDNEHRPIFPMIFWHLDRALFDGPGLFSSSVIFVLCFAICLMLAGLFRGLTSPIGYMGVLSAVAALMYSPGHFENLIWWKQLHVYMACAAGLASLHLAVKADTRSKTTFDTKVMAAVVLALIASFSFGYGLLVWPLLVGHALFSRWKRGQWVPLVTGILILTLFLLTYPTKPTPAHGSVLENLKNPGAVLAYSLELCGFMARRVFFFVFPDDGAALTRAFGLLMALVALSGFVSAYLVDTKDNQSLRAAVLIAGFSIGNSLLTGISRVTVNVPIAPRYLVISAIGIVATAAIISILASRTQRPVPSGKGLTFAFSLVLIVFAVSFQQAGRHGWKQYNDRVSRGAIAADVKATDVYPLLYPVGGAKEVDESVWPNLVRRAHNSGRYLGFGRQGSDLKSTFKVMSEPCRGAIDSVVAAKGQPQLFEVAGWARMGSHGQERAEFVLFTDSDDIVLGVGTIRKSRPDVAAHLHQSSAAFKGDKPQMAGFTALVRTNTFNGLKAYATSGTNACRLKAKMIGPTG